MKSIFTILITFLITATSFAQVPQKMSYQAVIRDTNDVLLADQNIGTQLSILQGSDTGTPVYVETQTTTTNTNGLVNIEIGTGNPVTGDFSTIDWAEGPYYMKTEIDPTGGSSYSISGSSQLLSVPYALYSNNSGGATNAGLSNCNCSSYIIPYMSYSATASQIIYVSNVPASWYNDGSVDNPSDISVEAIDDQGNLYDLGVIATVNAGVKRISAQVNDALMANGFTGGKVALRIVLSNPEHAFVYAAYNAGSTSAYSIPVECVR